MSDNIKSAAGKTDERVSFASFIKNHIFDLTAYAGLTVMLILFFVFNSGSRLMYNFSAVIQAAAVYSIIALGAVFIYSMGFMDVSLGQQVGVYVILMILIGNKIGGVPGVILSTRGLDTLRQNEDGTLTAGAGVPLARLAVFAQKHGLTGLEFAHGIPGTVGGGMYMNAGAYGGELVQVAVSARFLTPEGEIKTLTGAEMGLSYRHSAFMEMEGVILSANFRLQPGDPEAIQARMRELMERRKASQPLDLPSAGSTFKRPVGGYAAALIQQAGLKGLRVGDAAVSTKHSGFVVNLGAATEADVLALIAEVRERVKANSGIELEPEVRIWRDETK